MKKLLNMTNNLHKVFCFLLLISLFLIYFEKTAYTEEKKGSLVDKYFKDEKELKDDEKIADCPFCKKTIKIDKEGNISKFKEDKYQVEKFITEAVQGINIEYRKGRTAFIKGRDNTNPVYVEQYGQKKLKGYTVDSNIYLAQEYFKLFKNRFETFTEEKEEDENLLSNDKRTNEILTLLLKAANERIESIILESRGYFTKEKDYRGEWEKATAKANIADFCVSQVLSKLERYISKKDIEEWVAKYKIKKRISNMKTMFESGSKKN